MRKISDWLRKMSPGWVAALGLVGFVLFMALVLPGQAAKAEEETGGGPSPDGSFFYSPAELYAMAEAYGPEGRSAYIRARFTFDVVWPIVYTFFLATALSWLGSRAFDPASRWQLANLSPVLGMLLDYLENLSTSLVMYRYPAQTPVVDFLAPVFTATKWIFVNGSFVLLVVMLAAWAYRRVRGQR